MSSDDAISSGVMYDKHLQKKDESRVSCSQVLKKASQGLTPCHLLQGGQGILENGGDAHRFRSVHFLYSNAILYGQVQRRRNGDIS